MFQFLHWIRRRDRSAPTGGTDRLESILDAEIRRVKAVSPETSRQWEMLSTILKRREEEEVRGLHGAKPAAHPSMRMREAAGWTRFMPRPAVALAFASLMVLIVVGVYWLDQPRMLTYETGRGHQSLLTLAESTQVSLNHTSRLTVVHRPLEAARHVILQGEAFFRVQKDGTPFIVQTDAGRVRVLGTEFNVRVRDGSLEVAVLRGSVAVSVSHGELDSTVVLQAGQITACRNGGFPPAPSDLPFTDYPAWTHEKLLFYRTDLLTACREIEARFDVTVHLDDFRAGSEPITGKLDARSAESAVRTLAMLTGKHYRHENDSYMLY